MTNEEIKNIVNSIAKTKVLKGKFDEDLLGKIKILISNNVHRLYGYNSINEFLINRYAWSKPTTSERKKVANKYFDNTGKLKSEFTFFRQHDYSVLVKFADISDEDILDMYAKGYIVNNIKRNDVKGIHWAYKHNQPVYIELIHSTPYGTMRSKMLNTICHNNIDEYIRERNNSNSTNVQTDDELKQDKISEINSKIQDMSLSQLYVILDFINQNI